MKNNTKKRIPLLVFSLTLAALIAITATLIVSFAGSEESIPDNAISVADAANGTSIPVIRFDKEPTEEEISAALTKWQEETSKGAQNTAERLQKEEKERKDYDISRLLALDTPDAIYVAVSDADYGFTNDFRMFANNRRNQVSAKVHNFSGTAKMVRRTDNLAYTIEFSADCDNNLGYARQEATDYLKNTIARVTEYYNAPGDIVTYDVNTKSEFHATNIISFSPEMKTVPGQAGGILYNSTIRSFSERANTDFQIKDYGLYLGRKAVRITCDNPCAEKAAMNGCYFYEFIIDMETNANLATICYNKDGEIQDYTILTEFTVNARNADVPLFSDVKK